jgi:hypothetical protein
MTRNSSDYDWKETPKKNAHATKEGEATYNADLRMTNSQSNLGRKKQMKLRNILVVGLLLLVCGSLAFAQKESQATFKSLYTDMKRDCRTLKEPAGAAEEGGDPAGACKGFGGYRIFISHSAWSATYSIEKLNSQNEAILLGTDYSSYGAKGEKVEWRMANGKPFAVIMRIGKYKERADGENPYTDQNRTGSTLVVKGLKGWEHINFELDGATPNVNAEARAMADQNYSGKPSRK